SDWVSSGLDPQNFDRSERRAYWSATGLHTLLSELYQAYPGRVSTFAHSMGGIVMSEALRLEAQTSTPRKLVDTFVASQVAMTANAYDLGAPLREPPLNGWQTPEVYSNYNGTNFPYFVNIGRAATRLVNFYNPQDYALGWWGTNQNTKPDFGYTYDGMGG